MKHSRYISALFITIFVGGQMSAPVVLADTSPSPSPSVSVSPSPSDSPSPSVSPSPSTSPDPSASPSPSVSPSSSPSPAPSPTTGPTGPTGPSPDVSPKPLYAFDDSIRKWVPTIISSFAWDQTAGMWVSPFYTYDPVVGWYHVKPETNTTSSIMALTAGSANPAATLDAILGVNDPRNSNTGPNSNNTSTLDNTGSLLANLLNNISVANYGSQTSTSGNASVIGNTLGGSATTGAASVVGNLLNLLNSMWSWSSGGFVSFVHNIFGNQNGDINLTSSDVSGGGGQLGSQLCPSGVDSNTNTGTGSTNTATTNCANNLSVNSQNNGSITNNLDLLAKSGDATVSKNTTGGDAASGDARAELNIVNLINTAIGAGQTFFGVINIFGNLNGDILFPTLHLNGAVASGTGGSLVGNSNTGPGSTNDASSTNTNSADLTNTNTAVFNNNVEATATSGKATVDSNTNAGSAKSGTASTNTSAFNLFDTSVFGDNAVLVIVNDMGHWLGRIMSLNVNSTSGSGLLTSNATVSSDGTGPNSTNTAASNSSNSLDLTNSNTGSITNNVRVTAQSGDATVSQNTNGGSASTGNAAVASSIANIFGSHLSFAKIFGILIINVFGSWTGSAGVDTAAGNVQTHAVTVSAGKGGVPHLTYAAGYSGVQSGGSAADLSQSHQVAVAASPVAHVAASIVNEPSVQALATAHHESGLFFLAAALLMLAALMMSINRRISKR